MDSMVLSRADAAALVDDKEVLRLSKELIAIPSVYGHEEKISRFVHGRLDRWGLAPRRVPVKGHGDAVVAEIGSRKLPSVVLNGHMDTVEVASGWKHDPFTPILEKGVLYGLGSLDMKCGIASLMVAFRAMAEAGSVKGFRVSFQAVAGEEDTGIGTRTLIARNEFAKARAVIVGEGFGGLRAITNARRGGSYYSINVAGRSAHGATPHLGVNAISDASRVVCAIDDMPLGRTEGLTGDDFRPLAESQTVVMINGGTPALSVPDKCYVRVVRCTVPGGKVDASEEFRARIRSLGLRSKVDVRLMAEPGELYRPYLTDPRNPLVLVAKRAVESVVGRSPRLVCGVSEADDNIIANELGLPVICLGPGESGTMARYHQAEEGISVGQLGAAARVYCTAVPELGRRYSS